MRGFDHRTVKWLKSVGVSPLAIQPRDELGSLKSAGLQGKSDHRWLRPKTTRTIKRPGGVPVRPGQWRLRVGDWRAIICLNQGDRVIVVTAVKPRGGAYDR